MYLSVALAVQLEEEEALALDAYEEVVEVERVDSVCLDGVTLH